MSRPPLPADAVEMLRRPNPCVMATLRADGAPVSTATWYLWEDGRVLVNMDGSRRRLEHLRADPRVTLTVLAEGDWYSHVTLVGRVAELVPDEGLADIDRLARHYTGNPYPERGSARFSARIDVERWHGWGSFRDTGRASS
ncbi:PPOX class F420-dependent oxidoreductase [Streptomyces sp. WMMC500]|uniref:PPOX class F420-dependent oxidoreductase n=1 Tax=Streptomyces sp. WMMC500 TaxID=3015154 RepID=UPI00248B1900|nr:PPOX class F420-dependent oxidoreductase [Streptomyces sp. WMMC500]WBB62902.1 PPOX class F420-dependent oxidoreductase [Streptomyces sp. WMMC500]